MRKQFAIIGLGRFGSSICKELYHMGHEVFAIDTDEKKVEAVRGLATQTFVGNGTDENLLEQIGIRNFDHVIIAIGDDIQASILTTLHIKDHNVPNVWVKAQNDYHHKVLEKIGADRIFHPEKEMGSRIAAYLTSDTVLDYIDLSADYSIIEMLATKKVAGKTLVDLDPRKNFGCTIIAIKRAGKVDVTPDPSAPLNAGDILIMIGDKRDLRRFREGQL
ncbi:potassium channel family protein [Alkalicoccus daliensis]|uniref:Trk system potassium uptake protein TrkA n=1 Tax=Alkalicoccus daliensis TaxID=745820 RepID=A0A1G9ZNP5_9BACI|nr:TrkA family potassium uptake protein [Alkalicoccus daliensis]SDN22999.1 trk system potassium uptake protein TrkA [Alkalicoccus daliensis]